MMLHSRNAPGIGPNAVQFKLPVRHNPCQISQPVINAGFNYLKAILTFPANVTKQFHAPVVSH
uniref:Uncharacterized protein n=1 Tax=Anguilla anguilla TaxID=7936 RepID=A0A0E9W4P2_ANGAN